MAANPPNPTHASEPPELRLLLAAARTDSTLASQPELLAGIDWAKVFELASGHHVTPLVFKSISNLPAGTVPAEIFEKFKLTVAYSTRRNLFLLGELVRLLNLFDEHQIPLVPFKGPVLALQGYRDVSLRQCGDLDVLIRPSDVPKAKRLLLDRAHEMCFPTSTPREAKYLESMNPAEEANYIRCHSEYHLIQAKTGLNIDLHWRLNPPEMTVSFNEDELWGRLQSAPIAGRPVPQLGPADLMLLLCFNGAKDCWKRLDRVCDVAEVLRSHPDVDWGEAIDRARDIGVERMLLVGVALARELLDAPLSGEWVKALHRDTVAHAMVPKLRKDLASPMGLLELQSQLKPALFHLQLRERWSDRVKYCAARLSPTVGDWVALPLPRSLSFLYYFFRPIRLAIRKVMPT